MPEHQPIHVEINVQDYFFEDAEDTEAAENMGLAPIQPEQWSGWFQRWIEHLQPQFSPIQAYELSLRLTDDDEIQALNAQYRQKDQPTDVLAFAALEVDYPKLDEIQASQPLYLGDVVISVDTAQRQAQQQSHSLQNELAWLAAHGLLHLLGWDHPDDESLVCMLKQQLILLTAVGLTVDVGLENDF